MSQSFDFSQPSMAQNEPESGGCAWRIGCLLVAGCLLCVALPCGVGVLMLTAPDWNPNAVSVADARSREEGYKESFEQFSKYDPAKEVDRTRERLEIERLVRRLERAAQKEDTATTHELIDIDLLVKRAQPHSGEKPSWMLKPFVQGSVDWEPQWKHLELVSVIPCPSDPQTKLVYLYGDSDEEGDSAEWRFWVTGRNNQWRLYDWERLDRGLPDSKILGFYARDTISSELWDNILLTNEAINRGDEVAARTALQQAERCDSPLSLHDYSWLNIGYLWRVLGDEEAARQAFGRISDPDLAPGVYFAKMASLHYSDPQQAAIAGEKYFAMIGPSPQVCEELATLYQRLGDQEKALKHCRHLARISPGNELALAQLLIHGEPEDQETATRQIESAKDSLDLAVRLANLVAYQSYEALQYLARYTGDKATDSPQNWLVQGELKMYEADYESAANFFKQALKQSPDLETRNSRLENYLYAMGLAGKALQGYRSTEDKQAAFETLVSLHQDGMGNLGDAEYLQFLEEHRAAFPNDGWAVFYAAQFAMDRRQNAQAKILLDEALNGSRYDQQVSQLLLNQWSLVQMRLGNLTHLLPQGAKKGRFEQLAAIAYADGRYEDLQKLIDWRNKPDDPLVQFYLGVLATEQEDWPAAQQHYAAAYDQIPSEEQPYALHRNYLVALQKTGQWREFYENADDKESTLFELSFVMLGVKQWSDLSDLAAMHRRHSPNDGEAARLDLEVAWGRQDYAAYAERAAASLENRNADFSEYALTRAEDRLFTAYQKSGQLERAHALALKYSQGERGDRYLAVLLALAGDFEQAAPLAISAASKLHSASDLYGMEEYGSLFLNDEFAALHQQYPVDPLTFRIQGSNVATLYLDEPVDLTAERIRGALGSVGSSAEVQEFVSVAKNAQAFAIHLEKGSLAITAGKGRHPNNYLAHNPQTPEVSKRVNQGDGWLSVAYVSWGKSDPSDADMQFAREVATQLMGDQSAVLLDPNKGRFYPISGDNLSAWASGDWPTAAAPSASRIFNFTDNSSEERTFLRELLTTSANTAEAVPLEIRITVSDVLSDHNATGEKLWVQVDSKTRVHGGYRYQGKLKTASKLVPALYAGLPVVIPETGVTGWRLGDEERLLAAP